jgi:hypothetical protein
MVVVHRSKSDRRLFTCDNKQNCLIGKNVKHPLTSISENRIQEPPFSLKQHVDPPVKKRPKSFEPQESMRCSQDATTGHNHEPVEFI